MVPAFESTQRGATLPAPCALWDFCHAQRFFESRHSQGQIFRFDVAQSQQQWGVVMSIAALILVLLLPFAVGLILHHREAAGKTQRFG